MNTSPATAPASASVSTLRAVEYAYTAYPAVDISRARAFYENVCGLRPSQVWEDADHAWVEYDLAGHTLALVAGVPGWRPCADGASIALEVEDFDAAMSALRTAGAAVAMEPSEFPGCRMAVVRDPEGNSLVIHRRKNVGHSAA